MNTAEPSSENTHQQPAVERVRQRAAHQRHGQDRHELADAQRADRERRAGQVVHLERQRDERDHRAEERDELPEEQQPELAAAQRGEVEEQAAHGRPVQQDGVSSGRSPGRYMTWSISRYCRHLPPARRLRRRSGREARRRTATPTPQAASPAPGRLLALQRLGGVVATSETLYIGRDGAAALDRRHGGAGRRVEHFRITRERMAVIRRGLERLRAHPPREYADDPDGSPTPCGRPAHLPRAPGRMTVGSSRCSARWRA